jgi:hypothetical protein
VAASTTRQISIRNDGSEPLTLYSIWASSGSFTADVPQLRVPPESSAVLTVTYTAGVSEMETAILHLASDDPAQPLRKAYLVGNREGLGVGKPLPETIVALTDGGEWSSTSPENAGKVQMLAYFATF